MIYSRRLRAGAIGACVLAAGLVPALRAGAAPQNLGAVALAADEPVTPASADLAAAGSVDLTIDGVTGDVCVSSTITGLSGPITMAHIHTGGVGVNGGVLVPLPSTATSVSGCVVATPAQAQSILAAPNGFYFNVHTAASPAGALRGQLTPLMFNAALTGAAEIPGPGDTDGGGSSVVAVDTTANRACVFAAVTNIDLPATMAHIHSGTSGVAGPVVIPLTAPATASSASCGTAAPAVISAVVASPAAHYVNIHTTPFAGGAVRGQLSARSATVPTPSASAPTSTTVGSTTTGPTTTVGATTTVASAPTTTAATAATTTAPAAVVAPAEAVIDNPTFTG